MRSQLQRASDKPTSHAKNNKASSCSPSFVGSIVALIADVRQHRRPHIAVADYALAIAWWGV